MDFKAVLDVQNEKDVDFFYKDIKVIAARQVELIVSKVCISHEILSQGVMLRVTWE